MERKSEEVSRERELKGGREGKTNLRANSRDVVGRSKIVEEVDELEGGRERIRFG